MIISGPRLFEQLQKEQIRKPRHISEGARFATPLLPAFVSSLSGFPIKLRPSDNNIKGYSAKPLCSLFTVHCAPVAARSQSSGGSAAIAACCQFKLQVVQNRMQWWFHSSLFCASMRQGGKPDFVQYLFSWSSHLFQRPSRFVKSLCEVAK